MLLSGYSCKYDWRRRVPILWSAKTKVQTQDETISWRLAGQSVEASFTALPECAVDFFARAVCGPQWAP